MATEFPPLKYTAICPVPSSGVDKSQWQSQLKLVKTISLTILVMWIQAVGLELLRHLLCFDLNFEVLAKPLDLFYGPIFD